jgi:hypothetical protein
VRVLADQELDLGVDRGLDDEHAGVDRLDVAADPVVIREQLVDDPHVGHHPVAIPAGGEQRSGGCCPDRERERPCEQAPAIEPGVEIEGIIDGGPDPSKRAGIGVGKEGGIAIGLARG